MVTLSPKQAELIETLKEGTSLKDCAIKMGVSYSRINTLLSEIKTKFERKTREALLIDLRSLVYHVK